MSGGRPLFKHTDHNCSSSVSVGQVVLCTEAPVAELKLQCGVARDKELRYRRQIHHGIDLRAANRLEIGVEPKRDPGVPDPSVFVHGTSLFPGQQNIRTKKNILPVPPVTMPASRHILFLMHHFAHFAHRSVQNFEQKFFGWEAGLRKVRKPQIQHRIPV